MKRGVVGFMGRLARIHFWIAKRSAAYGKERSDCVLERALP
jgi:hypothetical protein